MRTRENRTPNFSPDECNHDDDGDDDDDDDDDGWNVRRLEGWKVRR